MVAAGVNMIVRVSIVKGSYDMLLQEGEFSKKEKQAKTKLDTLSGVYWCLATAIYLGWSFWTMRWDITWILWPVYCSRRCLELCDWSSVRTERINK